MKSRAELRSANLAKLKLGRYPWRAGIKYYIARREPYLSTSTITEHDRKLRMVGKELEGMKREGIVTTTDPRSIAPEDIEGYLLEMRKRNLEVSTREKYITIINGYIRMFGNDAIDRLRAEQGRVLPPRPTKRIRALNIDELRAVFRALAGIEGHKGHILRGLTALAFSAGTRPKEAILSEVKDLNLEEGSFYVRHPKGEESWASPSKVALIRGDMIPILKNYMQYRAKLQGPYLFPNPSTNNPYSVKTVALWFREISDIVGFSVRFKDFRSTLASITIEGDLSRLKAVSLQLRHTKISTTEQYYARIRGGEIERSIGNVWRENSIE